MLLSALIGIAALVALLVVLLVLRLEQKRGVRVIAAAVRNGVDRLTGLCAHAIKTVWLVVGRFMVQLGLRYVVHVFLRRFLLAIANLYDRLVVYFEYNRRQTKRIRKDKRAWRNASSDHLTLLQKHRRSSALSEKEKQARKHAALEGET
jgi:hypothetical protein